MQIDQILAKNEHVKRLHSNSSILLHPFKEYLLENFENVFQNKGNIIKVDLLRCHPDYIDNLEKHLYYFIAESNGIVCCWLARKNGGILKVYDSNNQTLKLNYNNDIVGPIYDKTFFWIDWEGEYKTPFSFDVEDHYTQIDKYLSSGIFSLKPGMYYHRGGILNKPKTKVNNIRPNSFFNYFEFKKGKNFLNFDPNEYCYFFDQNSYKISCIEGHYVIKSNHHRNDFVSPITVYMILPSGGHPIIGSHALPHVRMNRGRNIIILPGLSFNFTYGLSYYI